jgi:hypothetical protein
MDFIVFSDDWGRHISSCQHIFKIISRDRKVLWVNTVGMRVPSMGQSYDLSRSFEKILSWFHPLKKVHDKLYVFSPFMLPFQHNKFVNMINNLSVIVGVRIFIILLNMKDVITWTTVPNVNGIVGNLGEKLIIYNCTDDYSLWPGGKKELIQNQEIKVLEKSNIALASSEALAENCAKYIKKTFLYPHGVNIENFQEVNKNMVPDKMKNIPHPIIGFFGLLYEKINYQLIKNIANKYSQASIVLIGKQAVDLKDLKNISNIHLIGQIEYEYLPQHAVHFDVGLMPYVLDEEIRQSAPLKMKEYLAMGIPIVSVSIKDIGKYQDAVYIAENDNDFIEKVGLALNEKDVSIKQRRQKLVENESWKNRISFFYDLVKNEFNLTI